MSRKRRRKVSKSSGRRYTSAQPKPRVEAAQRVRPPKPTYAETKLRDRIQNFAYKSDRFKADMERALERYFEQKSDPMRPLSIKDAELPGFQE